MKKLHFYILMALFNIPLLAQEDIPLRDFFKNPDKAGYDISPDGKYLSHLESYEKRLNIFVQEIGKKESIRITDSRDRDIANYFWKGNDRILYLKDNGGDENFKLFVVDKDGKNLKTLTPFDKTRTEVVDELKDFKDEILISLNKRNPEVFDVYRLNVVSGEMTMVAENPGDITNWVTDHSGKIRIATSTDGVNNSVLYRPDEKSEFRNIITTNFKETLSPLFFTFDNKYIYAVTNIGRDKAAIVKYDIENGKELEVIFEHPDVDVSGLHFSEKRKVLTMISYVTWKYEIKFLDKDFEDTYNHIVKHLGTKYEINLKGTNDDENKYIVRTYSDRSLGSYYYYDKVNDKLTLLANVSPWLDENKLAEMKPVEYKSRDGLTIYGYLTLPKGREQKNLPIVVNPHGGPWYRDRWTFNPEVQFLASRGYGVLQMNFRGSTGYGRHFWEISFKQWGKQMQDDISDGVKWLIEQGIADPKRVAIYGGSYGGYATLSGLAFSPNLYAAGVDYVGVSNLFTFMKTIPPYWKPYLEMMYEMVGNPEKDSVLLEEASPVFHADKIKAPLLVIQGRQDPRVNINESDQMVEAMKKRGIDVEYLVKDNEGHGFRNEENRFEVYETMEKFLKKHLAK
jgi:dipeptidyl aminopeptidase/acylaminoacyl peptidase